ncbi:MAG TPA: metallophosphoesterase family protein [Solirubrobacterales bacterium]|nr:metallophosphoesterase family protein [Solirubrobacterales bacterium]
MISDIHANLPALTTVMGAIDEAGMDEVWCLGDAVGYGASPAECLEILFDRCSVFLVGNHDLAALGEIDISTFSPSAAQAALWTRENLGRAELDRLAGLDGSSAVREGIGLYHASPRDPVWEYVIETDRAEENLNAQPERIAMIGHSHISLYFTRLDEMSRTSSVIAGDGTEIAMGRGEWLVNPGSVGQPRDGDPRAAWLSLDTESQKATFHRIEYPVEEAATAIRKAGLPAHLADRLAQGH